MKFPFSASNTWKGTGRTIDVLLTSATFLAVAMDVASGGASGGLLTAGAFALGKLVKTLCDERGEAKKGTSLPKIITLSAAKETELPLPGSLAEAQPRAIASGLGTTSPPSRLLIPEDSHLPTIATELRAIRQVLELFVNVMLLVAVAQLVRFAVDEIFRFLGPGALLPKLVVAGGISLTVALLWQFVSPKVPRPSQPADGA
jgi:hypothetical protein